MPIHDPVRTPKPIHVCTYMYIGEFVGAVNPRSTANKAVKPTSQHPGT